jgi:putative tryptophan/tyrosine transport system substrate-binding protein
VVGLAVEVAAKGVEFLHELVPATAVVALLVDPSSPREAEAETGEMQVAARALGFRLVVLNASSPSEIEAAFATLVQERAGALAVASSTHFIIQINQIVSFRSIKLSRWRLNMRCQRFISLARPRRPGVL